MPDPFRHLQVGDPIPQSATVWNAMIDAGRLARLRGGVGAGTGVQTRSADIVRVKNNTGTDLPRYSVVGLDGPVFTPADSEDAFAREAAFLGVTPTSDHTGKFAVLLAPVKAGGVTRAYVAGVCPVKVDVSDAGHGYAAADPGATDALVSAAYGPAELLWKEADDSGYSYGAYDTGVQWALVRIGPAPGAVRKAKTGSGGIGAASGGDTPGSGNVTLCDWDAGTGKWVTNGVVVTALNPSSAASVAASTFVTVAFVSGQWEVIVEPCAS